MSYEILSLAKNNFSVFQHIIYALRSFLPFFPTHFLGIETTGYSEIHFSFVWGHINASSNSSNNSIKQEQQQQQQTCKTTRTHFREKMMMVVKRALQRVRLTIMITRVSFPSRFWHCSTPKYNEFATNFHILLRNRSLCNFSPFSIHSTQQW